MQFTNLVFSHWNLGLYSNNMDYTCWRASFAFLTLVLVIGPPNSSSGSLPLLIVTSPSGKLWMCLRSIISTCVRNLWLSPTKMESTTIYEDNSVLFTWKDDIDIQKIHSCENLTGLFIKSLPRRTFEQLVHKIRLCHLNDVSLHEGEKYNNVLFFLH